MSRAIGLAMENAACDYLVTHGLEHIASNYHCRFGEIDLIMQDRDTRVFIEVRYRAASQFGDALASITLHKQNKIIRTAKQYLLNEGLYDKIFCRFDVIAIDNNGDELIIDWIKNAFIMN